VRLVRQGLRATGGRDRRVGGPTGPDHAAPRRHRGTGPDRAQRDRVRSLQRHRPIGRHAVGRAHGPRWIAPVLVAGRPARGL